MGVYYYADNISLISLDLKICEDFADYHVILFNAS